MNNIQKMENKAYKADLKIMKEVLGDTKFYDYVSSSKGRRVCIRKIRQIAKFRTYEAKRYNTVYEALKDERDFSLRHSR